MVQVGELSASALNFADLAPINQKVAVNGYANQVNLLTPVGVGYFELVLYEKDAAVLSAAVKTYDKWNDQIRTSDLQVSSKRISDQRIFGWEISASQKPAISMYVVAYSIKKVAEDYYFVITVYYSNGALGTKSEYYYTQEQANALASYFDGTKIEEYRSLLESQFGKYQEAKAAALGAKEKKKADGDALKP
jgi:hypothetical protein